jgi:polar amino acid transport system permease protein
VLAAILPDWFEPVARYMLGTGLKETARLAAIAVGGSVVVGITLGTLLTIRWRFIRGPIRLYIEVWRGLPIIVTIFFIYFALPSLGVRLSGFLAAGIGLALWGSAQIAEATRGAVQSIPREQHEAASALGFGWVGRHVFIILPQSFRRLLPPLVSLVVNIIQNTTLASIIGVAELLATGTRSVERVFSPPPIGTGQIESPEIYGFVALVFFVISFPLTRLAAYLERRLVV